jgi:hypothetical protein
MVEVGSALEHFLATFILFSASLFGRFHLFLLQSVATADPQKMKQEKNNKNAKKKAAEEIQKRIIDLYFGLDGIGMI